MFDRSLDVVFACLLVTFSFPLLAFYTVLARLNSMDRAVRARLHPRRGATLPSPARRQIANEFSFEHAIEAYEALIDATVTGRRL